MTQQQYLKQIAIQLVGRIREDDIEDVDQWLQQAISDPNDWRRLCLMLAMAIPDDQSWSSLTAWKHGNHRLPRSTTRPRVKFGFVTLSQDKIRKWAVDDQLPDEDIAAILGCSRSAVGYARRKAKPPIPAAGRRAIQSRVGLESRPQSKHASTAEQQSPASTASS